MPQRIKTACRHPLCPELVDVGESYCPLHAEQHPKPQRHDDRLSAALRGYDSRWQLARAAYLSLHPLCAECARHQFVAPATCVDHIEPHRGDMTLFWDESNWQSLCATCHNRKTAKGK